MNDPSSIENKEKSFKSFLDDILKSVPSKRLSSKQNVPWMTHETRKLCRKKTCLYWKAKRSHCNGLWSKYKMIKGPCTKQLWKAHTKYIANVIGCALTENDNKPLILEIYKISKE